MPFGSFLKRNTAHFVPPPAAAGLVQAQMSMLHNDKILRAKVKSKSIICLRGWAHSIRGAARWRGGLRDQVSTNISLRQVSD